MGFLARTRPVKSYLPFAYDLAGHLGILPFGAAQSLALEILVSTPIVKPVVFAIRSNLPAGPYSGGEPRIFASLVDQVSSAESEGCGD